jgi:hypothetical protein
MAVTPAKASVRSDEEIRNSALIQTEKSSADTQGSL